MTVGEVLSITAGLMMLYSFIPYGRDILKGRVQPARSTRLMFALLLLIALLQQHSLGSGWLLAMTIGDGIGAAAILLLALKRGVGGLNRVDVACYGLLGLDVAVWLSTSNALLALHLSIAADLIAMVPVLVKTWHSPWSETRLFYVISIVAPLINIVGAGQYRYGVLIFPLYIAAINLAEVLLIARRRQAVPKPRHLAPPQYMPLT